jgi:hypothetical protein
MTARRRGTDYKLVEKCAKAWSHGCQSGRLLLRQSARFYAASRLKA